jgi:hypothetical protein
LCGSFQVSSALFIDETLAEDPCVLADLKHFGAQALRVDMPHLDSTFDGSFGKQLAPQPQVLSYRQVLCVPDQEASAAHVLDNARYRRVIQDKHSTTDDRDALFCAQFSLLH